MLFFSFLCLSMLSISRKKNHSNQYNALQRRPIHRNTIGQRWIPIIAIQIRSQLFHLMLQSFTSKPPQRYLINYYNSKVCQGSPRIEVKANCLNNNRSYHAAQKKFLSTHDSKTNKFHHHEYDNALAEIYDSYAYETRKLIHV